MLSCCESDLTRSTKRFTPLMVYALCRFHKIISMSIWLLITWAAASHTSLQTQQWWSYIELLQRCHKLTFSTRNQKFSKLCYMVPGFPFSHLVSFKSEKTIRCQLSVQNPSSTLLVSECDHSISCKAKPQLLARGWLFKAALQT